MKKDYTHTKLTRTRTKSISPSYCWSQVLDSNKQKQEKTNKLTAQGQSQALTMLDTWTRAHERIPSNPHNAGPADQGPQVKRESERRV